MPPPYAAASPLRPIALDRPPDLPALTRAVQSRCAASPHYTATDIEIIVGAYVEACATMHLDVVLALAQMLHESGLLSSWWCARPRRNPAGIGVTGATRALTDPRDSAAWAYNPQTGRFHRGYSYDRWAPDAVEAHVARLMWYAHPEPFSAAQQALYDRATAGRGMPKAARGSALTPRELGWAHNRARLQGMGWAYPGWTYGDRLAEHANALMRLM